MCAVEGDGEVHAIPNLCSRILIEVGATGWFADDKPIRRNRSKLVDGRQASPGRTCRREEIELLVEIARHRPADALLVVCDEDGDSATSWEPSAAPVLRERGFRGDAVMAVREYETWLLWNQTEEVRAKAGITFPDKLRDAKGALSRILGGYRPTTHQLDQTRRVDIARVRAASKSFDKLVRAITVLSAETG